MLQSANPERTEDCAIRNRKATPLPVVRPGNVGRSLGLFRWALIAGHLVVWMYFVDSNVLISATDRVEPLCWPFFEDCWRYRLSLTGATAIQHTYLAAAILAIIALLRQSTRWYTCCLIAANIVVFSIASLDYRFRSNQLYMLLWLNVIFLFWPAKRWAVTLLIVSFYFWAGALKLNTDWLSGAGLYRPLWLIPDEWTGLASAYVVVLEMLVIWGLMARRRRVVAAVLMQLTAFHVESLSQIHWFYPLLMATILSWFAIEMITGDDDTKPSLVSLWRMHAPLSAYVMLCVFAAFQLLPSLYRGDSVLTGQGRLFTLHMFEARFECDVKAILETDGSEPKVVSLKWADLPPRSVCDPIVYFNRSQTLCRQLNSKGKSGNLRLIMRTKRLSDPAYTVIVDEEQFCSHGHEYVILGNNSWMR